MSERRRSELADLSLHRDHFSSEVGGLLTLSDKSDCSICFLYVLIGTSRLRGQKVSQG
ncbi:MAG: hypothetical protein ACP5F6_00945 [Microbacter sp.]